MDSVTPLRCAQNDFLFFNCVTPNINMLPILPFIALGSIIYVAVSDFYKKRFDKAELSVVPTDIIDSTKVSENFDPIAKEKNVKNDLVYSISALTLTGIGIVALLPALVLIAIPIELYLFLPFIRRGYLKLFENKKISVHSVDTVVSLVLISGGYFFASALFFTFFNISQLLLLKTQRQSQKNLTSILGEQQNSVWLFKDGVEIEIAIDNLQQGDIIIVQAGEMIVVDGRITFGIASIDQHILTGESQPVEKTIDDEVFAGTVVLSGKLFVQVEKAGKETVAEQIGVILNDTAHFEFNVQTRGERYADQAALPTLIIAGLTFPLLGYASAATVLFATLGSNMRIIAPISVLNALKTTSKHGVLIKDGRALECLANVDTVIFDKTGTLTEEQPHIGRIYTAANYDENTVLTLAACAEYRQTHPIAKAIVQAAQQRNLPLNAIEHAHYEVGYGLKVNTQEQVICVGSWRFMQMEQITIPMTMQSIQEDCQEQGYSVVYVTINQQLVGAIELLPTLRSHIKEIVDQLHQRNIKTYIMSGDNEKPTQQLAKQLNIDEYFSEVLPTDKANLIVELQAQGRNVCFIGDGINDAIALKQANVSISLHGASSIATDTAQILLMDSGLEHIPWLFEFADKLNSNLQRSLILSVIPGFICIGGVYLLHFGVIAGTILYNVSLAVGVGNTMVLNDSCEKINQHNKLGRVHSKGG
ncbi:Heavy metal translocating P-type ATPase [Gammaproteobacteria bacterium]